MVSCFSRNLLLDIEAFETENRSAKKNFLDFKNVKVLAPSWADEFITNLRAEYKNPIEFLNTENESVAQSLKYVST